MTTRSMLALGALAAIFAVTVAWWSLALWPATDAPAWLERTREVCFGVAPGGLPNAGGWIVLIGEPLGMLLFLLIVWREAVLEGVRALARSLMGRTLLAASGAALGIGVGAVVLRVSSVVDAAGGPERGIAWSAPLDGTPPPLALVDQHGDTVRLEQFAGRPVLVVFAYGHCETVCPLIVRDAAQAVEAGEADATLLVVTLDPWRDTPGRLAHLAERWRLPPGSRVLGGDVEAVERTLDAWRVKRARDPSTGEIAHPTEVLVIDRQGRLARVASGGAEDLARLLDRT